MIMNSVNCCRIKYKFHSAFFCVSVEDGQRSKLIAGCTGGVNSCGRWSSRRQHSPSSEAANTAGAAPFT